MNGINSNLNAQQYCDPDKYSKFQSMYDSNRHKSLGHCVNEIVLYSGYSYYLKQQTNKKLSILTICVDEKVNKYD